MSLFSEIYSGTAVLDEAASKKDREEDDSGSEEGGLQSADVIKWFDKVTELAEGAGWTVSDQDDSDEPFIVLNSDSSPDIAIIIESYEGGIDVYAVDVTSGDDVDEGVSVDDIDDAQTALAELMDKYVDWTSSGSSDDSDDEGGDDEGDE